MYKAFLTIALFSLLSYSTDLKIYAQKTSTYRSEEAHFSLSYPSSFRAIPIRNAPHMLLHLQNNKDEEYTISFWEYELDESYDIWNPVIYQEIERNASMAPGVKLISSKKVMLTMTNQKRRVAEIIHSKNADYIVTYQTLWKGNLIQIVYVNRGPYTPQSPKGLEIINSIQLQ